MRIFKGKKPKYMGYYEPRYLEDGASIDYVVEPIESAYEAVQFIDKHRDEKPQVIRWKPSVFEVVELVKTDL